MTISEKKRFSIVTLGCKVNQYEGEAVANRLEQCGLTDCPKSGKADYCIINTCAVTAKAAMQSRQAVRQAIRNHPGAHIIVTGCYAQIAPQELGAIQGVHRVIGQIEKYAIAELIGRMPDEPRGNNAPCSRKCLDSPFPQPPAVTYGYRSRPFLKVQDGCNACCTYCIVPHARGPSRSMPTAAVLAHLKELGAAGFKEVVLTGIHLGCYGLDLAPQTHLAALLTRLVAEGCVHRLRLSSIEPNELTDEIVGLAAPNSGAPTAICSHFHMPLQSGDDHILKQMHRPYTSQFYCDRVEAIVRQVPDVAIGSDVLVGFPGETDSAFENTIRLIESLPLAYLHVFPFSRRKGTAAYGFTNQVAPAIIKQRCRRLRQLGHEKKTAFYRKFIGRPLEVLIERAQRSEHGWLRGISHNYIPVLIQGPESLCHTLVTTQVEEISGRPEAVGRLVAPVS